MYPGIAHGALHHLAVPIVVGVALAADGAEVACNDDTSQHGDDQRKPRKTVFRNYRIILLLCLIFGSVSFNREACSQKWTFQVFRNNCTENRCMREKNSVLLVSL